jgi:hypothetical protein
VTAEPKTTKTKPSKRAPRSASESPSDAAAEAGSLHPDKGYRCAAVSDSSRSSSSRSRGRNLGCRLNQYGGNDHGTRLETLAGCLRSGDGPGRWTSFDLSSRQRNSAPAAVLGSLQRCVPVRHHLKCVGNVEILAQAAPGLPPHAPGGRSVPESGGAYFRADNQAGRTCPSRVPGEF